VRADDGRLIWRFRAAPRERRIVAFDALASPTPVSGSVVVSGGAVVCVSGRTSELDGGLSVWALRAEDGEVLWHDQAGPAPLTDGPPLDSRALNRQGALPDLMTCDGRYVHMRERCYELATGKLDVSHGWPTLYAGRGGFLDGSMKTPWSLARRATGQLLAFSTNCIAGFLDLPREKDGYGYFTTPGRGMCSLFALPARSEGDAGQAAGWRREAFPVAVEAMLIAGPTLFAAGVPDAPEPTGGTLLALSLADGTTRQEVPLPDAPVFDGMAASGGRLYVPLRDGTLLCFGSD
jgi:hypothetical protein